MARGLLYLLQVKGYSLTRNFYKVIHSRQKLTSLMDAVFENIVDALHTVIKIFSDKDRRNAESLS